jgi:hypothetical protein
MFCRTLFVLLYFFFWSLYCLFFFDIRILPLTLCVRITLWRGLLDITLYDKVCSWLVAGRWFSPGTPVSSTNIADHHFYIYALLIVVCPFVLFLLVIVLSVLLRYTDSDCPLGISKLFLYYYFCSMFDSNSLKTYLFITNDLKLPQYRRQRDRRTWGSPSWLRMISKWVIFLGTCLHITG